MINNVKNALIARSKKMTELKASLDEQLKSLPEGSIITKRRKYGTGYYWINNKTKPKYLSKKDSVLIEQLIQKAYIKEVIKSSETELNGLNRMLDCYPKITAEDIYEQLSDDRKRLVKPIITPIEQYVQEWQSRPYTPKPIAEGTPIFETLRGERVRSKSEQIIADRLYANGIPYKYECPLIVNGKLIHPDFTILRRSDRKEVYHEHLGKTDDEKYQNDNVPRINDYILGGYMLGDKLFLSFESSTNPLDARVIDKLINDQYK